MSRIWKATDDEKRILRAYAAKHERLKPKSLVIEIGERQRSTLTSCNLLAFDAYWPKALDVSDLHQYLPWGYIQRGIELVDGRAVVDLYVSKRTFAGRGDLLTNIQAYIELIDDKPTLVSISGTGTPTEIVNVTGALDAGTHRD